MREIDGIDNMQQVLPGEGALRYAGVHVREQRI